MHNTITEYFMNVETTKEYNGYFCSVAETITIVILGSISGLKNVSQMHQWATDDRVSEFFKEKFGIENIPCYYWILCLLKLVEPASLNRCFHEWFRSMVPESMEGMTISLDGKTIRSTEKMASYESPLHVVSAQVSELGMTFAQKSVDGKSNEIPAVQKLLEELDISGCIIVADALNCQKNTAKAIIAGGADYVEDKELLSAMDTASRIEKSRDRIEKRSAYVTEETGWLTGGEDWECLWCIGAVHTEFESPKGKTEEWHYYISSRKLTAEELLHHARMEWSEETMHWLLDVHFGEDYCRVEDRNIQQNLNMLRKAALNLIKQYKERAGSKRSMSKIMFDCLLNPYVISEILEN
ncbi:MAG: ISAs1 family transposase [Lachnospiraceae bacterium]|nr:ISAs1 family transposase [Lachnospiraceae bacterium]